MADSGRMCASCADAGDLGQKISQLARRANQPLRVAVVGIMKAGKSTLLNALIKENLLFTGNVETTYTVCWFKYAEQPSLRIVFKQKEKHCEAPFETAPFEDLEKWTVRQKSKENPRINDVSHIEIFYPNKILKTIEFIDTPGLNSSYNLDSRNTLDFLGVTTASEALELETATRKEASQADAIVYAFTRSAGNTDQQLLGQFLNSGMTSSSSPINALGVYTWSDFSWEPDSNLTPVENARRITGNTMKHPEMKRLLYTTLPVTAKAVEGFNALTEQDWIYLQGLATLDQSTIAGLIEHVPEFTTQKADEYHDPEVLKVIGAPETRKNIEGKISVYGLFEIVHYLRSGTPRPEILEHLYEKTGIKAVNELITSHFGNRSFLIKTQYVFSYLKEECRKLYLASENKTLKEICKHILDEIDHIETTEHVFQELRILQNYYNSLFAFNNETEYQEFLQITGEMGKNCEAKLGLQTPMLISEMAKVAKEKINRWHGLGNGFGVSQQYEQAANVIARSYEIAYYHLNELSGN